MKIAVIDKEEQTFAYLNKKKDEKDEFVHLKGTEQEELSAIAKTVKEDNYDAVLINIESRFEGANRSDLKGVELIYWLRLKEKFLGTIVTYGFLSAAQILRLKPEYVVIHAPGNYHLRLPEGLQETKTLIKKPLNLSKDNIKKIYRPFAEKLFNIYESRHEKANWWAIKTMWDIENIRKNEELSYPDFVVDKLKKLNNYLATEIYKDNHLVRIDDIVLQITNKHKQTVAEINDRKKSLRKNKKKFEQDKKQEISNLEIQIEENKEYITLCDEEIKINKQYANDLKLYGGEETNTYIIKNEELKKEIEEIKKEINILIKKLEQKKQEQYISPKQQTEEYKEEEKVELSNEDKKLLNNTLTNTNKQTALIIEDMLDIGWFELYKRLFPHIDFCTIDFNKIYGTFDEKINEIKKQIETKLITTQLDFVILDIRLFPEDDSLLNNDYSGFIILDYIKENYGIPVLITSASNKIWTLKKSISKGANGYWIKEGYDNFYSTTDSILNYLELKNVINSFSDMDYKIYKQLALLYNNVEKCNQCWWEDYTWNAEYFSDNVRAKQATIIIKIVDELKKTQVKKKTVLKDLRKIKELFYNYLIHSKHNNNGKEIYKQIIVELGEIINKFHKIDKIENKQFTIGNVIYSRGDFYARILYTLRNDYFHRGKILTDELMLKFVTMFYKYLIKKPRIDNFLKNNQKNLGEELIKRNKQKQQISEQVKKVEKQPETSIMQKDKIDLSGSIEREKQGKKEKNERKTIKEKPEERKSVIQIIINWFSNLFKK